MIGDVVEFRHGLDPRSDTYNIEGLPKAVGYYVHVTAVKIGDLKKPDSLELRISGMLPMDDMGNVVGAVPDTFKGDQKDYITVQLDKILSNIALAISASAKKYNSDLGEHNPLEYIAETQVWLEDMKYFKLVNDAYERRGMRKATRGADGGHQLPLADKGVKVEIFSKAIIPLNP